MSCSGSRMKPPACPVGDPGRPMWMWPLSVSCESPLPQCEPACLVGLGAPRLPPSRTEAVSAPHTWGRPGQPQSPQGPAEDRAREDRCERADRGPWAPSRGSRRAQVPSGAEMNRGTGCVEAVGAAGVRERCGLGPGRRGRGAPSGACSRPAAQLGPCSGSLRLPLLPRGHPSRSRSLPSTGHGVCTRVRGGGVWPTGAWTHLRMGGCLSSNSMCLGRYQGPSCPALHPAPHPRGMPHQHQNRGRRWLHGLEPHGYPHGAPR